MKKIRLVLVTKIIQIGKNNEEVFYIIVILDNIDNLIHFIRIILIDYSSILSLSVF